MFKKQNSIVITTICRVYENIKFLKIKRDWDSPRDVIDSNDIAVSMI